MTTKKGPPVKVPKVRTRVAVVPVMGPCPDCGVELEPGRGKHKLAWHGCRSGPSTIDLVEQDVLKAMRDAAHSASVEELINLLEATRVHRKDGSASMGDLGDWIARRG